MTTAQEIIKGITHELTFRVEDGQEAIREFRERSADLSNFNYAIEWSENEITRAHRAQLAYLLRNGLQDVAGEEVGRVVDILNRQRKTLTKRLVLGGYLTQSTSQITNAVGQVKHMATRFHLEYIEGVLRRLENAEETE